MLYYHPIARLFKDTIVCSSSRNNCICVVRLLFLRTRIVFDLFVFFFSYEPYTAQRVVRLLLYRNGVRARRNVSNDRTNNIENRDLRRFRSNVSRLQSRRNFMLLFAVNFRLFLSSPEGGVEGKGKMPFDFYVGVERNSPSVPRN